MVLRDVDVVGGIYPTKSAKNSGFPYCELGPEVDGLQPVTRMAGGFMLLKRNVVEAIVATLPQHKFEHDGQITLVPYLYGDIYDPLTQISAIEDFALCDRLVALGFKLFAETNITFAHVGAYTWMGNLHQTLAEYAKDGPPVMVE